LLGRPSASGSWRTSCPNCWASRLGGVRAGRPVDVDQLQRRITELEQQVVDLRGQVEERDQELDAPRTANRELITNVNRNR
jgi:hypothetical protein